MAACKYTLKHGNKLEERYQNPVSSLPPPSSSEPPQGRPHLHVSAYITGIYRWAFKDGRKMSTLMCANLEAALWGKGREGYTCTLRGHQGEYIPRDRHSTEPQPHLPRLLLLILFISFFLPSVVVVLVTIVLFIPIGPSKTLYLY